MFTRPVVWPYTIASSSGLHLADHLNVKRVRSNGRYRPREGDLVINWGNSTLPIWWSQRAARNMFNLPQYVNAASNKTATFERLYNADVPTPEFTTRIEEARAWFENPAYGKKLNAVLCRTLTRANSGRGIVLATKPEEVVAAPLYTRYKPKAEEYRIHIWNGAIVDVQQKRKRNGFETNEGGNRYIRNHPNGWVFCRDDVNAPSEVLDFSLAAVSALGLDFGAVDVGWHPEFGVGVYEVNTAPGIEGQTLINYSNQVRKELYVRR